MGIIRVNIPFSKIITGLLSGSNLGFFFSSDPNTLHQHQPTQQNLLEGCRWWLFWPCKQCLSLKFVIKQERTLPSLQHCSLILDYTSPVHKSALVHLGQSDNNFIFRWWGQGLHVCPHPCLFFFFVGFFVTTRTCPWKISLTIHQRWMRPRWRISSGLQSGITGMTIQPLAL